MNQETKQFITDNRDANIHQLVLQQARFPLVDMPLAIRQINGMQKIKTKVPLFYNNDDILYPVQLSLEQSSSESTAKYKASLCEGNTLVDLTGGFGVDCSFMARGFKHATYVERQAELCELATHNFRALNLPHIQVINAETENYLSSMEGVDWVFIDPARRSSAGKKVVFLSDCEPDVSALSAQLLSKARRVLIKLSPMMDITAAVKELPNTAEIHILSVDNECKEVLLLLDQYTHTQQHIYTLNTGKNNKNEVFDFVQDEESRAAATYATAVEKYLYEPNAAVMKSGAFKLIAARYGLRKLQQNTHLYTSDKQVLEFPGRIFEVLKQRGSSKKDLKELSANNSKANITTRNYPLSVEELRKKLQLKDGGDLYLFACTLAPDTKVILECRK
ncbi:MAG: RsmD family RNA methyltransferase [Paludibacter sp.]|nr:RsmD family RNA methyltransferase [Paludibacter sp.]